MTSRSARSFLSTRGHGIGQENPSWAVRAGRVTRVTGRARGFCRRAVGVAPVLGLLAGSAIAEAAPALRVQVDQRGDFVLIGNTLGYDCASGVPAPVVGTVGTCGNPNDHAPDVFWRSDAPAPGQARADSSVAMADARSTAVLSLPAGAEVTHAFLYWGARLASAGSDDTVVVERPGADEFSETITALQSYQSTNNSYQSVADVTELVQAHGPGAYRISGVSSANLVNVHENNNFAGWWMVVFYALASDPPRNLALFDGFDTVSQDNPQTVTLEGFLVPNAGYDAKLAVIAFEGDEVLTGDQFLFGGQVLSNDLNPATNFFNGTRSFFGNAVSVAGDLPQLTGEPRSMSGIDLDVVDIRALVSPGQTSAEISATSSGDRYHLAGFVTSISTFRPDFSSSTKAAVDLDGGLLRPGDVIEYRILVENLGNDASVGTVLTDALPEGVTYLPGSIVVGSGTETSLTDQESDDQGEYLASSRTVVVRLGAGADATEGGTLDPGESVEVSFRVTVDADASGTIENQALITARGEQGAPEEQTPTDGNGVDPGVPPTPIEVDACATDQDCTAPTPYCDLEASPTVCVECLADEHCSGLEPTCDLETRTCACEPTGEELCDGRDNDCDGTLDEGCEDTDQDGLLDTEEARIGTDPNDSDSDDDGVPDGAEPEYAEDSDGDGLINALDPDSDDDGLPDGLELGSTEPAAGTDVSKGHFLPDADPSTTTNPLEADTDQGGVPDGLEDANKNGRVDAGERDPNDPSDDRPNGGEGGAGGMAGAAGTAGAAAGAAGAAAGAAGAAAGAVGAGGAGGSLGGAIGESGGSTAVSAGAAGTPEAGGRAGTAPTSGGAGNVGGELPAGGEPAFGGEPGAGAEPGTGSEVVAMGGVPTGGGAIAPSAQQAAGRLKAYGGGICAQGRPAPGHRSGLIALAGLLAALGCRRAGRRRG